MEENHIHHEKYVNTILRQLIEEPDAGIWSDPENFADTPQHLTESAAKLRTKNLAKYLLEL
jgi:hypothetical protein